MSVKYNGNDCFGALRGVLAIVERLRNAATWLIVEPVAAFAWAQATVRGRGGDVPIASQKETFALQGRSFHGR